MSGEKRTITIEIDGRQGEISAKRLESALASMERQFDPLGEKTKKYTNNVALLKAGLETGSLSVDQHSKLLGGLTRQYEVATSKLSTLNQQTQASSASTRTAAETTNQGGVAFGALATKATAAVAAVFAVKAAAEGVAKGIAAATDHINTLNARLNVLTGAAQGSQAAFEQVYQVAQRGGVALSDVADAYAKIAIGAREFGATTEDIAKATDTMVKLGRVAGASAQEIASGIQQFGQALASGTFAGDELRSIRENMPLVAKAIAREFGVSVGQLKALGEEGKLAADRVLRGVINANGEATRQFAAMPQTVEQASTRSANAMTVVTAEIGKWTGVADFFVNKLNQAAGILEKIGKGINVLNDPAYQDRTRVDTLNGEITRRQRALDGAGPRSRAILEKEITDLGRERTVVTDRQQQRAADYELSLAQQGAQADQARRSGADSRIKALEEKALTGAAKATRDYNLAIEKLDADKREGLITAQRYNAGVAAATAILAQASGGAKQTGEAIKALAEVTRDAQFSKLLADNADKGAAALAEIEAQAKAADKAIETLGKRDAVFEKKYTAELMSTRADKFRESFTLDTAQIERENQVLEAQIRLIGQRPEIADREIALLRIRNDLIAKGQKADGLDVEARAAALVDQEKLTRQLEDSKRAAELWAEPFKNAIQGVQSTFTDFFEKVFSGGVKSFSDLADSAKRIWFRLMAEMASVAIIRPVIQFIGGGLGDLGIIGPQTMQALGITGGGVGSVGGGASGGSGGGLAGALSGGGGGFNPFGMFGQGGLSGALGGVGRFLNTPFASLFGGGAGSFADVGSLISSGAAGSQFGSGIGGFLGGITPMQGLGALAGIGTSIFSFASGNPIGGATGLLGAGLSLIPGVGQVLGPVVGILGSVLGGLFKSKPFPEAQGWHTYNPATGKYEGRATFERGGMTAPIAPGIGNDALKLIGAFGGSVAEGRSAPDYYIWKGYEAGKLDATVTAESSPTYKALLEKAWASGQVKTTEEAQWAARTELWTDSPVDGQWTQLPINAPSADSEKVMQQLALLILKAGVRDDAFTGLTGTSKSIIRNYPDADTQGLGQALQWGKETYDVLLRGDTLTNAEKAITGLKDSFEAAIMKAKEYRLATDGLVAAQAKAINKYASDFQQSISDRILGIQDPAALAQVQLDREFDQIRKEAAYLNEQYAAGLTTTLININDIEKAYGLQREQIVSQQMAGLLELQKRLLYGDLSGATPAMTVAGTSATFQATLAQASAGNTEALARLSGAGADYVTAAEGAYGHTERFATVRDQVLAAANQFLGVGGVTYGGANSNEALQAMVNQLAAQVGTMTDQLTALMEQNALLIAELRRAA